MSLLQIDEIKFHFYLYCLYFYHSCIIIFYINYWHKHPISTLRGLEHTYQATERTFQATQYRNPGHLLRIKMQYSGAKPNVMEDILMPGAAKMQRIVQVVQQMIQRTIRFCLCNIRSCWISIHYITLQQKKNQTTNKTI